jgi:hypothetical protein
LDLQYSFTVILRIDIYVILVVENSCAVSDYTSDHVRRAIGGPLDVRNDLTVVDLLLFGGIRLDVKPMDLSIG